VRLDNFVIEKNLNHIRNELRQGKYLNHINFLPSPKVTYLGKDTVRHYIRRHFLYPHYVNEKKRTERGNEAIVCLS